ncbi:hypothetical protein [Streptomyces sp. NPDC058045]|uniref:hypothetical protein n=1 Tax=Streptomyces sp. NPDC058045 TaxID=3346311 RepID=UPI0036E2B02C
MHAAPTPGHGPDTGRAAAGVGAVFEVEAAGDTTTDRGLPPSGPARAPAGRFGGTGRRVLAAVVCGVLGAGAAWTIAAQARTEVPDRGAGGGWTYPRLARPVLPAGAPGPFAGDNPGRVHHADLRDLLLPAPEGATQDREPDGGWTGRDRFAREYAAEDRGAVRDGLRDLPVRQLAARAWTMPDGTRGRVYLLRFDSAARATRFVDDVLYLGTTTGRQLAGAPEGVFDPTWDATGSPEETGRYVFTEPSPYGAAQVRQAYVAAGDTLALVVQERRGGAAAVPFHQAVRLQSGLLG